MDIGFPREIKDGEARVAGTPETVRALVRAGHRVLLESGAGAGSGYPDAAYGEAGAQVVSRPEEAYACPLVVKVKELQPEEYPFLRAGSILFAYQQLARDAGLLEAVLERRVTCLAYESVTGEDGGRPLLAPMSTIAGLMSAQIAAWALQHRDGPWCGSGVLLPWIEGVPRARVLILGEGTVGSSAARAFLALGCATSVLGRVPGNLEALRRRLAQDGTGMLETALCTPAELQARLPGCDVLVGAVSIPGRLSPKLVTRAMLRSMRPGSVLVDVGIDMGGVAETSRQTKLSDPVYREEGVLHYCVGNIPALVPRSASAALAAATLPYLEQLAGGGLERALEARPGLRRGLLVHAGQVLDPGLAEDTGRPCATFPPSRP